MLTISCIRRDCALTLWQGLDKLDEAHCDNIAADLVAAMDALYRRHNLSASYIAFLAGPVSFTSSRIVCATCSAIQFARPEVIVIPVRLDEAIHALPEHRNVSIELQYSVSGYYVYTDRWGFAQSSHSFTRPDTVDISRGLMLFASNCTEKRDILPFYGPSTV